LILKADLKNAKNTELKFIWNQPNSETQPQVISVVTRIMETTALMDIEIAISLTEKFLATLKIFSKYSYKFSVPLSTIK